MSRTIFWTLACVVPTAPAPNNEATRVFFLHKVQDREPARGEVLTVLHHRDKLKRVSLVLLPNSETSLVRRRNGNENYVRQAILSGGEFFAPEDVQKSFEAAGWALLERELFVRIFPDYHLLDREI